MVEALRALGVEVNAADSEGRLPISMCGKGLRGGRIQISGRRSSQFLSGLLFLGALIEEDLHIRVTEELKSKPMVETTLSILKQGHVNVSASEDLMDYYIPADQVIQPSEFFVGSDPASACALLAVSSMVRSEVRLNDYREEEIGNGLVLDHMRNIGVQIQRDGDSILVKSDGIFKARDFDGSQAPDAVLPLAALSCFAEGTSRFYNIEHIRYKESDRISDFRQELLKTGARVDETQTELIVHGCSDGLKGGAVIDSHFDHAIVMALTAIGLKSDNPIEILGAQYVGQTYPKFFDDIIGFGCRVETIEQQEQERENVYA
jgi:3-phosphoshikimate 1-carboxyvinyltransferase